MVTPAPAVERTLEKAVDRFQSGRLEDARQLCTKLLKRMPDDARGLHLLGAVQLKAGRIEAAVSALRRAANADPENFEVWGNLATALRLAGTRKEAEAAARHALALNPDCASAHEALGLVQADAGRERDAVASLEAALVHDPSRTPARRRLAEILRVLGRRDASFAHYAVLHEALPDDAGIRNGYAVALAEAGRLDEAEALLRAVLAAVPDSPDAHANLGNVLAERRALDEAIERLRDAVRLDPDCAETRANLGHALRQAGRAGDAVAVYEDALSRDPDCLEAGFGSAVAHLSLGRFAEGWAHYLSRDSMREAPAGLTRSPLPEDLAGKRVLILADQGLGDEIFFLRFAPYIKERGAETIVRCDPRLGPMLDRAAIADTVLAPCEADPPADYAVSMGDLPHVLGPAVAATTPGPFAIPARAEAMAVAAEHLAAAGPPPYLGVTWRAGTPDRFRRLFKEAPIEALARAVAPSGMTVISVQRGAAPGETEAFAEALGRPVHDAGALNGDLEAMLALMGRLDVYVGVSNTNIHLRAGQGKTSHVLVPSPPEFRWMEAGSESPWFPGTTVHRQDSDGGWTRALAGLADALGAAKG